MHTDGKYKIIVIAAFNGTSELTCCDENRVLLANGEKANDSHSEKTSY